MTEGVRKTAIVLGPAGECGELCGALARIGVKVSSPPLDAYSAEEISAAVVMAAEELGAVDMLVYRAGGFEGSLMLLDIDDVEWDAIMNCGPRGFFLSCKYALPYLIGQEASAVFLLRPEERAVGECGLHVYASDAASGASARHMSAELAGHGVAVEEITLREDDDRFEEFLGRVVARFSDFPSVPG